MKSLYDSYSRNTWIVPLLIFLLMIGNSFIVLLSFLIFDTCNLYTIITQVLYDFIVYYVMFKIGTR